jgi:hypothetical protein
MVVMAIIGTAASKSSGDFVSLVSAIAAGFTAVAAVLSVLQVRELRSQQRVLTVIADEDRQDRVQTMDLPSLQAYLFETLGAMSIREYAHDQNARRFVARAVDRVEDFLEEGKGGKKETPGADHLAAAAAAMERDDLVGGLARLLLAIELALRDIALAEGLPAERITGGRLIDLLRRKDLLDPATSEALSYVVRVGNRAVHGEAVKPDEARETLAMAQRLLANLDFPGRENQ